MAARIKHSFAIVWLLLLFNSFCPVYAQYFQLTDNRKQVSFPFRLIRNMAIIKLRINGTGPYNFILDTGVGLMIITDPVLLDSLSVIPRRNIKITGLGANDGYDAYYTRQLDVSLPGIKSIEVAAAIFKEDHFGLSNYAGMPIHGLLGYEFFNKLAIKFSFNDSTITVYRPGSLKRFNKYIKIPVTVENNKPYIMAGIQFCDKSERSCKLIVDIGAGHPLLLDNEYQWPVERSITANLGMGLTGPINGEISRVNKLILGKYNLNNVLSCFPKAAAQLAGYKNRDGNLGMDVLKRFTVIFDYADSALYLKPRGSLKEPFERDMSGLEYFAGGEGLNHVFISRVEPGSAGDAVGLEQNDELVALNFKPVSKMSLEEIDSMFRAGDGREVLVKICHNNIYENVILTLKRRI